jgi:hypothetical protein
MTQRLRPDQSGKRRCLKCNALFPSTGAGNRICRTCSKSNAKLRVSEAQLAHERGAKRLNGESLRILDAYESSLL